MQCAESLRLQAYFDGEVDAVAAAEIERHAGRCPECRALLEDLEQTRARMLDEEDGARASKPVAAWPAPWRIASFWLGAAGGLGTALAAGLVFLWVARAPPSALPEELVAAHVRSLMPSHLTDVLSTDQHTVKPWFAGHADVSPAVADFAAQGYRLVGGRADYLAGQRTAAVVYQHGAHIINVFSWASPRGS
ncbi:MAG: zf-HC2 domain-containing protein, partial [Gammaproteobacteria bacterium]|nr:zf-HC2 domain-containing protein [Gammaproteobacteria bacterium]